MDDRDRDDPGTRTGPGAGGDDEAGTVDHLRAIWVDLLGHDDFDDEDAFFDVGGDSLLAAEMHERLVAEVPCPLLTIGDVFGADAFDTLARRVEQRCGESREVPSGGTDA